MRNNVPDGDPSALVPPADVDQGASGPTGRVLIEQLRASIRALEQDSVPLATPPAPGAAPPRPACSLTSASVSEGGAVKTPLSAFRQGGLHEIKPHAHGDTPAALGFALSVIAEAMQAKPSGLVLWCLTQAAVRDWGRPYGPGLLRAGLDPLRFLIVETRTAKEAAWAVEEGLKSGALIASLAQTEVKTQLTARRLGLAAQAARTPCLLLCGHGDENLPGTLTRWRIATEGSAHVPFDRSAPGTACWRLSLERCRGQAPGRRFHVEAPHEPDGLRVVSASADRAAEAGEREQGEHTATG